MPERLLSAAGIAVLLALAWALSTDRRRFPWRLAAWGLGLQAALALLLFHTPPGRWIFESVNSAFLSLTGLAGDSAGVIFGGGAGVFAVKIAAIIIFFASLMSVLYHLGAMQHVVRGMAWIMARTLRISGAESLACAANVFVGMTEAAITSGQPDEARTLLDILKENNDLPALAEWASERLEAMQLTTRQ